SVGRRYRRHDAIGTPFCITVDHDTLTDEQVTVRDRDTLEQVRIPISEVNAYITRKLSWRTVLDWRK
ncbi:MAG: His/Gly/Thr/Pro-type tRNA ligase C-terminal domain-containing protein, partial [Bacteroidota bacterium]